MIDLDRHLHELADLLRAGSARPDRRMVVFAGAAVSMAGPSYLPPAAPLMRAMLSTLLRGSNVEGFLGEAGLKGRDLVDRILAKSLVPEAIYQTLSEIAGLQKVVAALRVLDSASPNANHHLVAKLARAGSVRLILTTNFDTLFERALKVEGQPFEVRIGDEATPDWISSAFATDMNAALVWKIHGDIADANDPAKHSRLVTTINQIGVTPSAAIAAAMARAMERRSVLVLGYSANDRDLAGTIAASDALHLFWNALSRDPSSAIYRIMNTRPEAAARWLVGDINVVLGKLADKMELSAAIGTLRPNAFAAISTEEWEHQIVGPVHERVAAWDDDPATSIEARRKALAVATILRDIGEASAGAALCGAALHSADGDIKPELEFELGRALVRLGRPGDAENHLKAAAAGFDEQGRIGALVFPLVELAGLLLQRGELQQALDDAQRALELSRSDRPTIQANVCMLLGEIFKTSGQIERARQAGEEARRLFAMDGSVGGEAQAVSFLALLAEIAGDFDRAVDWHRIALDLSRLIGDAQGEATSLNRIGEGLRQQGKFAEALEYYQQARALYEKAGDGDGLGAVYNNIGIVLTELGNLDEAERLLRQSIEIHRKISDIEGEAQSWLNLGNIDLKRRRWSEALTSYGSAERLFAKSDNARGIALIQMNLGGLSLYANGNLAQAIGYFSRAHNLFVLIGDDHLSRGVAATLAALEAEQARAKP